MELVHGTRISDSDADRLPLELICRDILRLLIAFPTSIVEFELIQCCGRKLLYIESASNALKVFFSSAEHCSDL